MQTIHKGKLAQFLATLSQKTTLDKRVSDAKKSDDDKALLSLSHHHNHPALSVKQLKHVISVHEELQDAVNFASSAHRRLTGLPIQTKELRTAIGLLAGVKSILEETIIHPKNERELKYIESEGK